MHFFVGQLTAAGVRAWLRAPLAAMLGDPLDLSHVLADAQALKQSLDDAGAFEARVALIVDRLRGAVAKGSHRDDTMARLADQIAGGLLRGSVDALASHAGLGVRELRRRFQAELGLSPKSLLRLARFERMLHAIHVGTHGSWLTCDLEDAALEYVDQAHLIRDFQGFAGVTPGVYRRHKLAGSGAIYTLPGTRA